LAIFKPGFCLAINKFNMLYFQDLKAEYLPHFFNSLKILILYSQAQKT